MLFNTRTPLCFNNMFYSFTTSYVSVQWKPLNVITEMLSIGFYDQIDEVPNTLNRVI